ncbi:unnamed protein product, partial [Didymodactylos carnosus]
MNLLTLIVCVLIPIYTKAWWHPKPLTTWTWQLQGTIDTTKNVQMYDIDLFDTPIATISKLKQAGRTVICYFSAGSFENWRPDASKFPKSVLGSVMEDWCDSSTQCEWWLNIKQANMAIIGPIMQARLDLAKSKGCDGVEPDNIDGYTNENGVKLTYADQLAYNKWLAQEAHKRQLSIGLKNDLDQIPELVGSFDWALNEQCFQYNECNKLLPFINADKAVFICEYKGSTNTFCPKSNQMKFSTIKATLDLNGKNMAY